MSTTALPATHGEFLEQFVATATEDAGSRSHDGNEVGISKRQKIISKSTRLTAPDARYGLGGDDNLYLQLGLSVLHTASEDRALAPAALYAIDIVHAISDGINKNIVADLKKRKEDAREKLPIVFKNLEALIYDMGFEVVDDLLQEDDRITPQFEKINGDFDEANFTRLLNTLKEILESNVAKDIALYFENFDREGACCAAVAASEPPSETPLPAAGASPPQQPVVLVPLQGPGNPYAIPVKPEVGGVVGYALARGICGHRGPAEAEGESPTDKLLPYAAPKNIASMLARTTALRRPAHAPAPSSTDAPRDDGGAQEAMAALAGNYAIDDTLEASARRRVIRDARQVRWEPTGEHAVALARAAAYEHAIARCGQLLADPQSKLSANARRELRDACLSLKLRQIDSMHELACAAEDGETLHRPPVDPLVTRPTSTIRGQLHMAYDAGHHPAPETSTVLAESRWTQEHVRTDAAFRKANLSGMPLYKAPTPHELGYLPVATAAPARVEYNIEPTDDLRYVHNGTIKAIRELIEYGLYYADVPDPSTVEKALNGANGSDGALGTASTRRSGIWNEMLRDIAVSTDRLWTFVRTLSGLIGEDADGLLVTADEATAAAARDLQAQRKATADRVAAFQGRLIESLVGSMMRESGLRLDTDASDAVEKLVVVNAATAKQMNDLASGESGRPFFEANVALRALADRGSSGKHKLGDVVAQINGVVQQLHQALDQDLQTPQMAGASLAELSAPRNSYFVKLRDDTTAAIRSAYDKFSVECSVKGVGRISLWELVEGADHTLCSRFAELVGHVLVQNRTSTGVSALYTSRQQLMVNASQAQVALQRLVNQAGHYRSSYPKPDFGNAGTTDLGALRRAYFGSHREQAESWVGGAAAVAIRYAQERHLKHVERVARPGDPPLPHLRPWLSGVNHGAR
jgi:hypothetical protein